MNVELTGAAAEVVNQLILSGDATTPEEAVQRMAERYVAEQALLANCDLEELDAKIEKSLACGESIEVTSEYFEKLREHARQHGAKQEGDRRGA